MRFRLFKRTKTGENNRLGKKGEKLAARYLKKQGYKIIERNCRIKRGELDIIAKDGDKVAFVEVKTRSSPCQEFLRASINRGKKKRLAKSALYYLAKDEYRGATGRFDVVFVIANDGRYEIELVKNAYRLDEVYS